MKSGQKSSRSSKSSKSLRSSKSSKSNKSNMSDRGTGDESPSSDDDATLTPDESGDDKIRIVKGDPKDNEAEWAKKAFYRKCADENFIPLDHEAAVMVGDVLTEAEEKWPHFNRKLAKATYFSKISTKIRQKRANMLQNMKVHLGNAIGDFDETLLPRKYRGSKLMKLR